MSQRRARTASGSSLVFVMCVAGGLVFAATGIIAATLSGIAQDLRITGSTLQWVVDVYPLVLATLLLPAGALLDRHGRRLGVVGGLMILSVSHLLAPVVHDARWLIGMRGLSGVGAALLFPGTLATLTARLPQERHGRAVSFWAASTALGGFGGFLVGGLLGQRLWWGATFLVFGAAAATAAVVAVVVVPDSRDPAHASRDPLGALLSAAVVGGLVIAITEGPTRGWAAPLTLGSFAVAGVAAVGFVGWELRARLPLLDLRFFRRKAVLLAAASVVMGYAAAFGALFLLVDYLVFTQGYSTIGAVMTAAPLAVGLATVSLAIPRLRQRHDDVVLLALGVLCIAVGFVGLSAETSLPFWFACSVGGCIVGAGIALSTTPATSVILDALPPAQQGVASAINDTARELGAALGIAVLGSLYQVGYRRRLHGAADPARVLAGVAHGVKVAPPALLVARHLLPAAGAAGWRFSLLVAAAGLALGAAAMLRSEVSGGTVEQDEADGTTDGPGDGAPAGLRGI